MSIDTYAPMFIVEIGGKELPEDISAHIENFSYEEHEKEMDELKITITKADISFVDNPLLQEGKEIRVIVRAQSRKLITHSVKMD